MGAGINKEARTHNKALANGTRPANIGCSSSSTLVWGLTSAALFHERPKNLLGGL